MKTVFRTMYNIRYPKTAIVGFDVLFVPKPVAYTHIFRGGRGCGRRAKATEFGGNAAPRNAWVRH